MINIEDRKYLEYLTLDLLQKSALLKEYGGEVIVEHDVAHGMLEQAHKLVSALEAMVYDGNISDLPMEDCKQ